MAQETPCGSKYYTIIVSKVRYILYIYPASIQRSIFSPQQKHNLHLSPSRCSASAVLRPLPLRGAEFEKATKNVTVNAVLQQILRNHCVASQIYPASIQRRIFSPQQKHHRHLSPSSHVRHRRSCDAGAAWCGTRTGYSTKNGTGNGVSCGCKICCQA